MPGAGGQDEADAIPVKDGLCFRVIYASGNVLEALNLLYDSRFKGVNGRGRGANVGGSINPSTPSYVLIQSNFPEIGGYYQAVTVFGSNQSDRATFCQEIERIGGVRVTW